MPCHSWCRRPCATVDLSDIRTATAGPPTAVRGGRAADDDEASRARISHRQRHESWRGAVRASSGTPRTPQSLACASAVHRRTQNLCEQAVRRHVSAPAYRGWPLGPPIPSACSTQRHLRHVVRATSLENRVRQVANRARRRCDGHRPACPSAALVQSISRRRVYHRAGAPLQRTHLPGTATMPPNGGAWLYSQSQTDQSAEWPQPRRAATSRVGRLDATMVR